jgi:tight adherence protein B
MLVWSLSVVFVITFLVLAIALVVAYLVLQNRAAQQAGADSEDEEGADAYERLLKSEELSSISVWHSLLKRFDFVEILNKQIAQADLYWSVGRVTLAMLLCGAVALYLLTGLKWLPLWASMGGAWFVSLWPYLYIRRRRNRRFAKFREGFPDALDSLSRGMRAGYPLIAALEMVANETEPPVSTEIRKTFVEANLGVPWEQALANLGVRMPLAEVNLFVAAVQIHQRTGGRLSDVIARLTEAMREQIALSGEIGAIAAHGRITGVILTVVPIGIAAMMMMVSPQYLLVLMGHPYGKHMIAAAAACLVLAHFVMRKLTDIKI